MSLLAPEPDFRHVSLAPGPRARARVRVMSSAALGAFAAATVSIGTFVGWREAASTVALGAVGAAVGTYRARASRLLEPRRPAAMSIVPWGVIVDEGTETRVLRWGAVSQIEVETIYGRDQATDYTRHSIVLVDTQHDKLIGRAFGAVPLEGLLVHREAYAREEDHVAAADLEGVVAVAEPWEPQVERLLLRSAQMLRGGGKHAAGYRGSPSRHAPDELTTKLREVLRDRTDRSPDPRPLSAILAAELGLASLTPELAQLVSSPHPLTAATARAAGLALGLPRSRIGVLDEVAPFLAESDVDALTAWTALRLGESPRL